MSSLVNSQTSQTKENSESNRERFLRFSLNSQIDCLLFLGELKGVININLSKILPVPKVEEYWLGIINWRGEAVWILDLAKLLGAKKWYEGEKPPLSAVAILTSKGDRHFGMLVKQTNTIESYNLDRLLPMSSSRIDPEISPFLRGYFLDDRKQPLMTIDIESILECVLKN